MNPPTDNDRLLDDVLAESAPADFRETLLGETLHLARHRRHRRQTQRAAAVLMVVGALAFLVWRNLPQRPTAAPTQVAGCRTIHTQPLPAGAIVTTRPLTPDQRIAPMATVKVIQTASASKGDYREIGDGELLALVAARPAVLVGCGPQCKQLIFVNPEDEKGFPVN